MNNELLWNIPEYQKQKIVDDYEMLIEEVKNGEEREEEIQRKLQECQNKYRKLKQKWKSRDRNRKQIVDD